MAHRDLVGLVRVSTDRQDTQRQHDALDPICVRVFEETISGTKKTTDRPGLQAALAYLRPGDLLTVQEVDRLGRNLLEGLLTLSELFQRGVAVKVLDGVAAGEHTDRSLVLDLALALAEDRRRDIARKTRNGLDAARARGTTGGRPTVVTGDRRRSILARRAEGESLRQIARGIGISPAVVHRVLHEAEQSQHRTTTDEPGTQQPTAPSPPASSNRPGSAGTTHETTATAENEPRAIRPAEHVDPDTVTTTRNPDTGTTRVLATAPDDAEVVVGFLTRSGRQWRAADPHRTRLPGHWRTKNEALLHLIDRHVPSHLSAPGGQ